VHECDERVDGVVDRDDVGAPVSGSNIGVNLGNTASLASTPKK